MQDRVLCHRHHPHHPGQRERGHVYPGPKVQVLCVNVLRVSDRQGVFRTYERQR